MPSGESGIRTHAPFRTNGFQDRLVMTTSISLRMCVHFLVISVVYLTTKAILTKRITIVNTFFTQFLLYFFQMRKSPFYHGSGLFLICIEYSFLPKLCSKSFNCYNYFYYLFLYTLYPCMFFRQGITPSQSYGFPYLLSERL